MSLDPRVVYRVDARDRLVWVNEAWHRFARVNDGAHLASDTIFGRDLWSLIGGDQTTVLLYSLLLERVRASGRPVTLPFRCDGPGVRRLMLMNLEPLPHDGVEFRVDTVATSARRPVALFDARTRHASIVVSVCTMCARIDVGEHGWLDVEAASTYHRALTRPWPPTRGSTLCPTCLDDVGQALGGAAPGHFGSATL